ncbi:MAG: HEAT repeat domain-containing protein [Candidatus Kapabacteria bacterium]|nr:HEAT repeat domain-containing protein [Candidatus Kapabacteria bacterium]
MHKNSMLLFRCSALLVVLFFGLLTTAHAQRSISSSTLTMLDSALFALGMRQTDLRMPADLIDPDRHRMVFHDVLFNEPLRAFDIAKRITDNVSSRNEMNTTALFTSLMKDVDLGTFRHVSYDGQITADETVRLLGNDPTARLNIVSSFLVVRFLSAIVQAAEGMEDGRKRLLLQSLAIDNIDSLWRLSREDESLSLWELNARERSGQVLASNVYAEAAPRVAEDIFIHGLSLYQQLIAYVQQSEGNMDLLRDSVRSFTFKTPLGRVAIGGPDDDVYVGSYAVIIDVGGNDVYRLDDTTKADALAMPIRCIIDLSGDDLYVGRDFSFASGVGGVGILIDRKGNDTYSAGDYSLACGLFGVGILHDMAGDDSYLSGSNTQGAGIFGLGILFDDNGHDLYRCHAQAQAFGGTRGAGILSDLVGNDRYIAASPYVDVLRYDAHQVTFTQGAALGSRPIASGGIGVLVDGTGNDVYTSDIYGQGTGYWFGLGALIDLSGDDRYESYQYAQGAGVHFATGILRDSDGDDVYVSHGVSQGCGHDIALGALLDESGNDVYVCESLSLGGGNANAVSLFMDQRGNDAYIAANESNTLGYSDFRRSYGMIGVFLDGGGSDMYGERTRNNTVSTKSTYGVFVDREAIAPVYSSNEAITAGASVEPVRVSMPLSTSVDSLFIQASAAPLRFQLNVEPARKRLGEMGTVALSQLETTLGTLMPRERLTLESVLPALYQTNRDSTVRLLLRGLSSDDAATVNICATVAGKVKSVDCVQPLIVMTLDSSWKRRRLAAFTLGEIGDTMARSALTILLHDEHAYVRQRAAFALGRMGVGFDTLRSALEDEDQIARFGAIEGVVRGPKRKMSEITALLRSMNDPYVATSGVRLIACSDTTKVDVKSFKEWYAHVPMWVRDATRRNAPQFSATYRDLVLPSAQSSKKSKKRK